MKNINIDFKLSFDELVDLDEEQLNALLNSWSKNELIHLLKMMFNIIKSYDKEIKTYDEMIKLYKKDIKLYEKGKLYEKY